MHKRGALIKKGGVTNNYLCHPVTLTISLKKRKMKKITTSFTNGEI